MHERFLKEAIRLSMSKMQKGCGGPFGALVVRKGKVVARGYNRVTSINDPTAHAEIVAIRAACRKLRRFHLSDCVLYSSCEPCPMCLAAVYWARLPAVYYSCTREDAARSGFDDKLIYQEIRRPKRIKMIRLRHPEALEPFAHWDRKSDKVRY